MQTEHDTTTNGLPLEQQLLDAQARIHRSILAAFIEAGVDARSYFLLSALDDRGSRRGTAIGHLRHRRVVAALVERGLVTAEGGELSLTDTGREALEHLARIAESGRSRATDVLTTVQRDALEDALTALTPPVDDADAVIRLLGPSARLPYRSPRGRRPHRDARPPFDPETVRAAERRGHRPPRPAGDDEAFHTDRHRRFEGAPWRDRHADAQPCGHDHEPRRRGRGGHAFERGFRLGHASATEH